MKIIYLSTPAFGLPILKALEDAGHEIKAVVCQPDKPNARGKKIVFSPVKAYALERGYRVLQYSKISVEGVEDLKSINADVMITAAYGQILSQEIIDICPYGIINVHGSLLPKYRGAAPVNQCIIDGCTETGITIMQTQAGMDDGDMLLKQSVTIGATETAGELMEKLSKVGASLLVKALDGILNGTLKPEPQNHNEATFCKKIKDENGLINFNAPAFEVKNFINGYSPEPCLYFTLKGDIYKVYRAQEVCNEALNKLNLPTKNTPGTVLIATPKVGLIVTCATGAVSLLELQKSGGKRLLARDFLNGNKILQGTILNETTFK